MNIKSLEDVVRAYLKLAEEKTETAKEESQQMVLDIEDLDNIQTPERWCCLSFYIVNQLFNKWLNSFLRAGVWFNFKFWFVFVFFFSIKQINWTNVKLALILACSWVLWVERTLKIVLIACSSLRGWSSCGSPTASALTCWETTPRWSVYTMTLHSKVGTCIKLLFKYCLFSWCHVLVLSQYSRLLTTILI